MLPISTLGVTRVPMEAAQEWARRNGAHARFVDIIIPSLYRFGPMYNVPAENLVVQSGHETALGNFTGVVSPEFHNPGGIKTRDGGGDYDPDAHQRFDSWDEGCEAKAQHVAKYGGNNVIPEGRTPLSPRLHLVTTGSAPYIRDLGGKYAPSLTYGERLEGRIHELIEFAQDWGGLLEGEPVTSILGAPFRVSIIPQNKGNRPGYPMKAEWITVHETGNPRTGANAEMHRQFTHNGGGTENVSFHYVVDDREIIQLLPLTENAWHAGDGAGGTGNRKSISIELCVNKDGDFEKTLQLGAALVRWLMRERSIELDHVVQHNHWSGKNCPATLRSKLPPKWQDFLNLVGADAGPPWGNEIVDPQTGKKIIGGFKHRYEAVGSLALAIFGRPLTDETKAVVDGAERTVQVFERGGLWGWYPEDLPHGVPPSDPMHVRVLTTRETAQVLAERDDLRAVVIRED